MGSKIKTHKKQVSSEKVTLKETNFSHRSIKWNVVSSLSTFQYFKFLLLFGDGPGGALLPDCRGLNSASFLPDDLSLRKLNNLSELPGSFMCKMCTLIPSSWASPETVEVKCITQPWHGVRCQNWPGGLLVLVWWALLVKCQLVWWNIVISGTFIWQWVGVGDTGKETLEIVDQWNHHSDGMLTQS